jgi:hypothetical protein
MWVEIAVTDGCSLYFNSDYFISEVKVDTINSCLNSS